MDPKLVRRHQAEQKAATDALVVQAAKQELSATDQWLVEFLRMLDESSMCTRYEGAKDIDRLRLSLAQCTPFMRVGKVHFDLGIT